MYVFREHIYFLEQEDVVLIYKQEEQQIHLYDIVSQKEVDLDRILQRIIPQGTYKIIFYFTPPRSSLPIQKKRFRGNEVMFVKGRAVPELTAHFKHPLTSQA